MTQQQRDYGKVISIAVLAAIILLASLSGCVPYMYKSNQIKVTHVLAVTEVGDTVKIAMKDIRPTQIYNVVGYDFVRGYNNPYYDPWRPYHMYDNHYRYYGNATGTNINSIKPAYQPNIKSWTPPVVNNNGSNTTGGGINPIARNPVTIGGGKKKNN